MAEDPFLPTNVEEKWEDLSEVFTLLVTTES